MNELSLFTGAGGGMLGGLLLGWRTIGYVEINEDCQAILVQRIKDGHLTPAPIFGDIKQFIKEGYAESYKGMVDVISGGFPCQDISVAKDEAKGIEGERSGLWEEFKQCICIIKPRYVVVENSPTLTFRGLETILRDLASLGYDANWGVFSAADVGAQHRRERLWIVADSNGMGGKIRTQSFTRRPLSWYRVDIAKHIRNHTKSKLLRMDDGMADRMDRIRAIGNGQVPGVARTAWETLSVSE